ncbi:MAG TPA: RIP metalloprotease RseP [Burkholderiales bacterium]|nr:RIP metalloprotease RseP [Burkholderiales bacterium]
MSLLHTIASFVVALGLLIVVHELGHYVVARWCGVKVLRFSVGFGRALVTRRLGPDRTEWVIAAVPLGGYVKMVDEREGDVAPADLPRAFNRQSVWKRFAIVAAGPVANFLLAIALYWGLFMSGVQEAKPILAAPEAGTVAAQAGLRAGDTIRAINDEPVTGWQDVRWRLLQLALDRKQARIEVADRRGAIDWRTLDLSRTAADEVESDLLAKLGMRLYRPELPPVIGKVIAGGVAAGAGLAAGDRVTAVDGERIASWEALVAKVRASPGRALVFEVERAGATQRVELVPEGATQGTETIGRIGAAPQIDEGALKAYYFEVRYGPAEAAAKAVARTWEMSVFSLRMLGKMVVGEISWRNLSGPVTIADYAGQSASLGLAPYLAFLALISISLGVLNLLPIPVLDGGHLMYYMIEVLKGSPVSERAMEIGQRAGLAVLLFLMAFAFYNDINRLLTG